MVDRAVINYLTEVNMGTAMAVALIFQVLEKKGLISDDEAIAAIKDATDQIPKSHEGEPRYGALHGLRVLIDDPEMRHTTPFPWAPNQS